MAKKKQGKKAVAAEHPAADAAVEASKIATETADGAPEITGEAGDEVPDQAADRATEPRAAGGLEAELEAARLEAQDAADRALRTLAEFDNFRRRSERQLGEVRMAGAADVLRELLDVADNLDRAIEHAGKDVPAAFVDGMNLVARGLHDLLDRKGVARMQSEGHPFDPERHEALTVMPTDGVAPNTVVQEVQPGYMLGERVLRPAKVIVSAASSSTEGNGS